MLEQIECSNNLLADVPPEMGNCIKLRMLNINNNKIRLIPPGLALNVLFITI